MHSDVNRRSLQRQEDDLLTLTRGHAAASDGVLDVLMDFWRPAYTSLPRERLQSLLNMETICSSTLGIFFFVSSSPGFPKRWLFCIVLTFLFVGRFLHLRHAIYHAGTEICGYAGMNIMYFTSGPFSIPCHPHLFISRKIFGKFWMWFQ